jgi:hypothetical protein
MDVSRVRFFKIMTGDFAQYLVSMLCPLSSMVLRNAIQHLAVKSCGSLVLVLLLDKCYRKRKENVIQHRDCTTTLQTIGTQKEKNVIYPYSCIFR